MMPAVTAPAARRRMVPSASTPTAVSASRSPVPTITRSWVAVLVGKM